MKERCILNTEYKVGNAKIESQKNKIKYVKPKQSADTIFNFMTEFEHLQKALENRMLSPRYCTENIRYLKINRIEAIAIPMKCFCDINLHKLEEHISWYGGYAIGFSKEYGRENGIQPITYINEKSMLAADFRNAFNAALQDSSEDKNINKMKNYLLEQLMYVKPIEGKTFNHSMQKQKKKCLTDEQEWRFIPSMEMLASYNMKQVIIDKNELDKSVLLLESNALDGKKECSLLFEYDDIKYMMVMSEQDSMQLCKVISKLDTDEEEKRQLYSKIIVWDTWKGDL